MPLGALVTITPKAGREDELMERVADVIADVRTEPGNLLAVTLRDPQQPGKVILFEIYQDQAAIEAHRAAAHSREKGPAVQELIDGPIDTRWFDTVDWRDGEKALA